MHADKSISPCARFVPAAALLYPPAAMLLRIFFDVLGPILAMIGVGAFVRWRFKVDIASLSKLNIYVFVPGFVFYNVAHSTMQWDQMAGVVGITAINVFTIGLMVGGFGRLAGVDAQTLSAVALAAMFYNSGNYGLPLVELAAPNTNAPAVQTFVLLTQNILTFTCGLVIAAWAGAGGLGKGLVMLIRLPMIPALVAALLAKWWIDPDQGRQLPAIIEKTTEYLKNGLVPIALVTLGAQLAKSPRWPRWKPVAVVAALRLVVSGLLMMTLLWIATRIWPSGGPLAGIDTRYLILTAGTPTAVNTLLLTLELGGDADLAADCVFWTTLFSIASVAIWLLALGL